MPIVFFFTVYFHFLITRNFSHSNFTYQKIKTLWFVNWLSLRSATLMYYNLSIWYFCFYLYVGEITVWFCSFSFSLSSLKKQWIKEYKRWRFAIHQCVLKLWCICCFKKIQLTFFHKKGKITLQILEIFDD